MPDEHIFNFSANIYYFDDNSFLMNIATQKPPENGTKYMVVFV